MSDDYRVQLDMYNGPMDLLLYLIRRDEIDIYDIPIVEITNQYVAYVELLQEIDPNAAGEFLVLASTLMEIKSRMLLPKPPPENEEEFIDPRLELVRQLLEYKKFKDAAEQLRDAAEERAQRYARQPAETGAESKGDVEIESLHMWDLIDAFREVMAKVGRLRPHEVQYDDTPISLHAADIVDRLEREGGSMRFEDVFEGRTRSECIGLFLALLELIRQHRIRAEQDVPFSPIFIHLLDATPIEEPLEQQTVLRAVYDQAPPESDGGPQSQGQAESAETELAYGSPDDPIESEDLGEMPEVPEISIDPTGRVGPADLAQPYETAQPKSAEADETDSVNTSSVPADAEHVGPDSSDRPS